MYLNRYLIYELTKREFQRQYVSNLMGLAWAVLDPLALMLIFWLIFGIGLRGGRNMDVPFVTYLITGLASYTFIQKTLGYATRSISANAFLLTKVDFWVSLIPLVQILSGLVLHAIVIGIAGIILIGNGVYPSLYWLQLPYYIFAAAMLLLGLSWITSSINLFFPDISNIITIVLRFFFYLTPIFWSPDMFRPKYITILKINPIYYIVWGYRECLLFNTPFWEDWTYALYFWGVTAVTLILGVFVFLRLKPHFADVV